MDADLPTQKIFGLRKQGYLCNICLRSPWSLKQNARWKNVETAKSPMVTSPYTKQAQAFKQSGMY